MGNKLTPYYAVHVFQLTCGGWLIFTGKARFTCASVTRNRFLRFGRVSYVCVDLYYIEQAYFDSLDFPTYILL